jgi:hypothetical protein
LDGRPDNFELNRTILKNIGSTSRGRGCGRQGGWAGATAPMMPVV